MSHSIGKEFMMQTDLRNLGASGREAGLPKPSLLQSFANFEQITNLVAPEEISVTPVDIRDAIERRTSIREYSGDLLTEEELSYLLWCTQGVRQLIPDIVALRNVPSAGGRNAFETYLLVNRVAGLQPGIYRYLAIEHKLAKVHGSDSLPQQFSDACDEQEHVVTSAVTFIWTAIEQRMTWVYGERGYRYIFLDAGHVCQNLYLAAESIDCGVCAVGHFHDKDLGDLLDLDEGEQSVIYMATVGKKESSN